jgi:hypothetical protein
MRTVGSRCAVRAVLALALLLVPLGAGTAAAPADAGARPERVVAHALLAGEQAVLADRQALARAVVDPRGDAGRARSVLLGILIGIVALGAVRRWPGRPARTIRLPGHGTNPACASRAPPGFRTA